MKKLGNFCNDNREDEKCKYSQSTSNRRERNNTIHQHQNVTRTLFNICGITHLKDAALILYELRMIKRGG